MSNINRDYLIVLNPKTSKVTVPELNYYIYDKYTANLFVNLVTTEGGKVVNLPDADQYKLVLHVLKPTNEIQDVENIQVFNKEKALFQIELDHELTKNIGRYKCELLTIDKNDHVVQSAKFSYRVKKSIYNDLDVVTETPEYPIIIRLLDKLQDIDKYEEERRANEVARVAAEKARVKDYTDLRQTVTTNINTMQEKIDSFDGKVQEVDNAVQQMTTNIDKYQTEKNKELDNYKTQKDTQINTAITNMENTIDTYKTEKDTQINDRFNQQDTKIDSAIDLQNKNIQASTKALNDKLDKAVEDQNNTIEANNQAQNKVINDAITEQNKTINTVVENDKAQDGKLDALGQYSATCMKDIKKLQDKDVAHEERMTAIEAVNVEQNNRLDAIEIKNDQQDNRLNNVEAKNKKQDLDLKCLFAESHSERITLDDEVGNSVFLQNSKQGFATVDELKGNTLVNCNKDTDKELILNGNIDTSGYTTVTTTEGVDGGKVDVSLEGNTMVNVCDQEEPIAITKSYTVETGNHIALQGEYDGKCRPNIYGNTMVNIITSFDYVSMGESNTGDGKYDYSTGSYKDVGNNLSRHLGYTVVAKPNTLYTVLANIKTNTLDNKFGLIGWSVTKNNTQVTVPNGFTGQFISTFTTTDENLQKAWVTDIWKENTTGTIELDSFMILEGDYTNKPIPDYFTGMKSSFEDKLVPEDLLGEKITNSANKVEYSLTKSIKPNTTYTIYLIGEQLVYCGFQNDSTWVKYKTPSQGAQTITTDNNATINKFSVHSDKAIKVDKCFLVEGDYTNYDFTDYDSTKAGKYKIDYKVTGKNKFNKSKAVVITARYLDTADGIIKPGAPNGRILDFYPILENTTYTLSKVAGNKCFYAFYNDKKEFISGGGNSNLINTFTTPASTKYIRLYWSNDGEELDTINLQIEEGTTATDYEPYKESIKTLYLNSPLLEGDTIEQSGNNIIHNHRYKEVVFDGSSFTNTDSDNNGIHRYFSYNYQCLNYDSENSCYCDKLPVSISCNIDGCITFSGGGFIEYGTTKSMSDAQQWLQQNPVTVVYKLATPTQEIISTNDNLLLDSYTNGHLDVDSVVPIDKVEFRTLSIPLKYVCANTNYTIQFESDNVGKLDLLYMNGASLSNIDVVKGLNKITCTTLDKGWSTLDFIGIGFNASKIVVTPKVDNNFGYFKGMKSVGECEGNKIEILSQNKNLFDGEFELGKGLILETGYIGSNSKRFVTKNFIRVEENSTYRLSINDIIYKPITTFFYDKDKKIINYKSTSYITQIPNGVYYILMDFVRVDQSDITINNINNVNLQLEKNNKATSYTKGLSNKKEILLNEPLRGLPNGVKDKYVIIDGKWYIERNCIAQQFKDLKYNRHDTYLKDDYPDIIGLRLSNTGVTSPVMCAEYPYSNNRVISAGQLITNNEGINIVGNEFFMTIKRTKVKTLDFNGIWNYFTENPIEIITKATTPTYEPIDYNPFEVYTDTTHISNNSNIPCNMVIRNSGFNCILKPNTTYTVSSNNGLSSVVTKDSIGDGILRFYDKDTTSVNTMKNVLVLEGDYITGNPPIPAFFEGMESAFEQELVTDENDEHYGKYKVEVLANNADNTQENNITFYINEPLRGVGDIKDKVYVKEDKVVVERNCASVTLDGSDTWNLNKIENNIYTYSIRSTKFLIKMKVGAWESLMNNKCYIIDKCGTATTSTPKNEQLLIHNTIEDKFIWYSTQLFSTVQSVKQYLNNNPFNIVYQLATPTYEEVEYFDLKLFVEIFKDTTINYNSNIPVTSTINYTYSTPLTDAVNTVSDISDQQDSMIIDMATQVASMEMMLM